MSAAFKDPKVLEEWLKSLPPETRRAAATRVALRVWPAILGARYYQKNDGYLKLQEQLTLTSGLLLLGLYGASVMEDQNPSFRDKLQALADAMVKVGERLAVQLAIPAPALAARAISSAHSGRLERGLGEAGRVFVYTLEYSDEGRAREADRLMDECLQSDASRSVQDMYSQPLMAGAADRSEAGFAIFDADVIGGSLIELDGDFDFFRRWYEGIKEGRPLSPELCRYIVEKIPDEIWTGDDAPRRVAEEIARIEAEFLAGKTRLSETVSFNTETGKFRVDPAPMQNPPLIGALLSRTEDALEDALQGGNGLQEDMRIVRVLRRTHARYANDPQRIELDYTSVACSL